MLLPEDLRSLESVDKERFSAGTFMLEKVEELEAAGVGKVGGVGVSGEG